MRESRRASEPPVPIHVPLSDDIPDRDPPPPVQFPHDLGATKSKRYIETALRQLDSAVSLAALRAFFDHATHSRSVPSKRARSSSR